MHIRGYMSKSNLVYPRNPSAVRVRISDPYIAPEIRDLVTSQDILAALFDHEIGKWGDMDNLTLHANELALRKRGWVVSRHKTKLGDEFFITTDTQSCKTEIRRLV